MDWPSKIGPFWSELATPTLGLKSFLTSDASTCCRGPRCRPSGLLQGILHYFSLFFSLNLWVLLIYCGVWTVMFWERELSFFLNWFSLFKSLWLFNLFAPVFFFFFFYFIRWCVTVLVSCCWWVCLLVLNLSNWLLLCESYLLSGGRWSHGAVWCGVRGGIFELGK